MQASSQDHQELLNAYDLSDIDPPFPLPANRPIQLGVPHVRAVASR